MVATLVALGLSACSSYIPLYGQGASTTLRVGDVQMLEIKNRQGERRVAQLVYRGLKQRFPMEEGAEYTLFMDIDESSQGLALDKEGTEERRLTTLVGILTVLDSRSKPVLKARVQASSSVAIEDEPMATEAGERRARESAGYALVEAASQRLFQFLQSHNIPLEK